VFERNIFVSRFQRRVKKLNQAGSVRQYIRETLR